MAVDVSIWIVWNLKQRLLAGLKNFKSSDWEQVRPSGAHAFMSDIIISARS